MARPDIAAELLDTPPEDWAQERGLMELTTQDIMDHQPSQDCGPAWAWLPSASQWSEAWNSSYGGSSGSNSRPCCPAQAAIELPPRAEPAIADEDTQRPGEENFKRGQAEEAASRTAKRPPSPLAVGDEGRETVAYLPAVPACGPSMPSSPPKTARSAAQWRVDDGGETLPYPRALPPESSVMEIASPTTTRTGAPPHAFDDGRETLAYFPGLGDYEAEEKLTLAYEAEPAVDSESLTLVYGAGLDAEPAVDTEGLTLAYEAGLDAEPAVDTEGLTLAYEAGLDAEPAVDTEGLTLAYEAPCEVLQQHGVGAETLPYVPDLGAATTAKPAERQAKAEVCKQTARDGAETDRLATGVAAARTCATHRSTGTGGATRTSVGAAPAKEVATAAPDAVRGTPPKLSRGPLHRRSGVPEALQWDHAPTKSLAVKEEPQWLSTSKRRRLEAATGGATQKEFTSQTPALQVLVSRQRCRAALQDPRRQLTLAEAWTAAPQRSGGQPPITVA
eukprot:CAMPEP_0170587096 /NCGR_PEP_ID=MMETSP0224-20130122/10101_1 /TAXON_ID=285029 /ORGANISM="Togula jolla, Strain CCCM 725" /LENGTH=503 /DNA_ID=CAMNT_0010910697 /DNA_START=92 /DNA_END=1600 /DNA_ORIENTATION=+